MKILSKEATEVPCELPEAGEQHVLKLLSSWVMVPMSEQTNEVFFLVLIRLITYNGLPLY